MFIPVLAFSKILNQFLLIIYIFIKSKQNFSFNNPIASFLNFFTNQFVIKKILFTLIFFFKARAFPAYLYLFIEKLKNY